MRPDLLFIKPGSQKKIYGALSSFDLTAIEPPLWAAILAGYLRARGYAVDILDAEVESLSFRETAERISRINPVLAAVVVSGSNPSASTMNMYGAEAIVSDLKSLSPDIPVSLGGLHPSALPERTVAESGCDYVIQGEGFYTYPALIDALKAGRKNPPVKGLWYENEGTVAGHPRPDILADLSVLPMPAWDLLPMKKYRAHNWHCFDDIENRSPYYPLYTSLGCPYNCSFCCINSLFGKRTIRYRPVEQVLDEIDFVVREYGMTNIKLIDEMFAINEKRVSDLCDRLIERNYSLNIWAYARVNTVTELMLEKMKKAGINWVAYGFESGSPRVIKDVSKGYSLETVDKVVRMTYNQGMHICANFIFGLPEDDFDTMNDTLKLMLDINAEWANIYSAMAYPGSALYDDAVKNNLRLPESWSGYSQYSRDCLPLSTNHIDGRQVLAFRDYAFDVYYRNPRYLNKIKRTFGEATLNHIRQMASKTLERDHSAI